MVYDNERYLVVYSPPYSPLQLRCLTFEVEDGLEARILQATGIEAVFNTIKLIVLYGHCVMYCYH